MSGGEPQEIYENSKRQVGLLPCLFHNYMFENNAESATDDIPMSSSDQFLYDLCY